MTDSYVAWNGKKYSWPPPEGWYEASDGRWWAANSGPEAGNKKKLASVSSKRTNSAAPSTTSESQSPSSLDQLRPSNSGPSAETNSKKTLSSAVSGVDPASAPESYGSDNDNDQPAAARARRTRPATRQESETPSKPKSTSIADLRPSSPPVRLLAVGAAGLVVIALAGFALTRGDGDPTTLQSTTIAPDVSELDNTTNSIEDVEDPLLATSSTPNTATTNDPGASDPPNSEPPTPSSNPASTTTVPDRSEPVLTLTTVSLEDSAPLVQKFRDALASNGLASDRLTAADVVQFGSRTCNVAAAATPGDFRDYKDAQIAATVSDLTAAEQEMVIDSAASIFCPDEASRLGI